MPRRISNRTKIKRGWGQLDLEHPEKYKPGITTRELPGGSGKRHMIPDLKYPTRMIHLLSNLEKDAYYMLRQNEAVVELFEQFPLDLRITTKLSADLGFRHPKMPQSNEFAVMTTDFLALIDNGGNTYFRAFAIKPAEELKKQRVREKLLIEEQYWKHFGIKWACITEHNIECNKRGR